MEAVPSAQASRSKPGTRGRVLVIFPGALGDLICLGPALRAIARRHRALSVELMAREELARFAVGRMGIARGHSIDRREVSGLFVESTEPANSREPPNRDGGAREVGSERFFAGFDRIYSFFASGHRRFRDSLTIASSGTASFHPFRPGGPGHVAAAYLRSLGEDSPAVESRIELLADDIEAAAHRLKRHGLVPGKFVLLLPGSGSPAKNWPAEKFAQLGEEPAAHAGAAVVLGPAEYRLEPIFAASRLPVMKDLELGEFAAIAAASAAFVGNDSGPSHLAAAAGARGVVLFGPTDPDRWGPLGRVTILRRAPLKELAVAEVLRAVV